MAGDEADANARTATAGAATSTPTTIDSFLRQVAATPAPPIDTGAVIEPDRYVDRVEIARGGMGRIIAARDQRLARPVALKELRADRRAEARTERTPLHSRAMDGSDAPAGPTPATADPAAAEPAPADPATTIDSFLRQVAATSTVPDHIAVLDASPTGGDAERYTDDVEIARGGMGRILAAYDRRLGRTVAVKVLRDPRPALRVRFERETLLTAQLQHPAIVSLLEAGRWRDGEPCYVMKLVPGRSLDQVVASATTAEARMLLVPHVQAVADALAYAHGQRVIHRDLKPHNVLVGAFGETVVIDWGLGKRLDEGEAGPEAAAPDADAAAPGMTMTGDVLGTPAYMPPEQAAGEAVDERADVYAIGALLYHVLTGAPPYRGKSTREVLAQVRRGPPVPLAERQPALPPDLVAIVTQAMARDPVARYASAAQLAHDLRRFGAGQLVAAHRYSSVELVRRWVRRHRAVVAVAAVAVLTVATVAVTSVRRILAEERRADAERRLAVQHRGDAEELIDFMLGDLQQRLQATGRLELLDVVARKARDYYDARGDDASIEGRRRRASALRLLAIVLQDGGELRGALALFQASSHILVELAATHVALGDLQVAAAESELLTGNCLVALGETGPASALLHGALARLDALGAARSAAEPRRLQVTVHHALAGLAISAGDVAGALAEDRAALAIAQALAAADPADTENARQLAMSQQNLGIQLLASGDATGALAACRDAVAIRTDLAAAAPADTELQYELMLGQTELGTALEDAGDEAGALAAWHTATTIGEALTRSDPSNTTWAADFSLVQDRRGRLLARRGELDDGLAATQAALQRRAQLVARDPANVEWRQDLASSHMGVADVLNRRGELDGAEAEERAALAIDAAIAASAPANSSWQREVAVHHVNLGQLRHRQGDGAGAIAEQRAAIAVLEPLTQQHPDNQDWAAILAGSRLLLAEALRDQHELGAATAEARAAVASFDRLSTADPTNRLRGFDRLHGRQVLADLLLAQRDHANARAAFAATVAVADELVGGDALSASGRRQLVDAYRSAAAGLAALGDRDGARRASDRGREVARRGDQSSSPR